jgi:hypothetical protein
MMCLKRAVQSVDNSVVKSSAFEVPLQFVRLCLLRNSIIYLSEGNNEVI